MDKYKEIIEHLAAESDWRSVIRWLDRETAAIEKKETRRHVSLEYYSMYFQIPAPETDIEDIIIAGLSFEQKDKRLIDALECLSSSQYDVIYNVYFAGLSLTEYAALRGISRSTVSITHKRALNNLKKNIIKTTVNYE